MMDTAVGRVRISAVLDLAVEAPDAPALLPGAPLSLWRENSGWLVPTFWDPARNTRPLSVHSWVLRDGQVTVLVDTGAGSGKQRPGSPVFHGLQTDYLDNLRRAGVEPEDVDVVVNTHLHADHVGWNTRLVQGRWVPTFPNAVYLLPARDVDFWDPNGPSTPRMVEANRNVFDDSVRPVLDSAQAVLWDGRHDIDWLRVESAPGHTPGSSVALVEDGSQSAVFVGDVLHSPLQVLSPECASCYCEDPDGAASSRRRVLGQAADRGALVLPAHLPGARAMTVSRRGAAFAVDRWQQFLPDGPDGPGRVG